MDNRIGKNIWNTGFVLALIKLFFWVIICILRILFFCIQDIYFRYGISFLFFGMQLFFFFYIKIVLLGLRKCICKDVIIFSFFKRTNAFNKQFNFRLPTNICAGSAFGATTLKPHHTHRLVTSNHRRIPGSVHATSIVVRSIHMLLNSFSLSTTPLYTGRSCWKRRTSFTW